MFYLAKKTLAIKYVIPFMHRRELATGRRGTGMVRLRVRGGLKGFVNLRGGVTIGSNCLN